jgi:hypothetical protein
VLLFGRLVPRAASLGPNRAAATGVVCGALSAVPGIALLWLGVPFVTGGAAIALGLEGRHGGRRWQAIAAIVLGSLVVGLGTALYAYVLVT